MRGRTYLVVCAVSLLYLWGVDAQLIDIPMCIGDNVTYTCTVNARTHRWDFGEDATFTVSSGDPLNDPVQVGVYSLEVISSGSNNIVSTLSVTAFAELNGTQISCRDSLATAGEAENQTTTAVVFGLPTPPPLAVTAVNLTTFSFTISPPVIASQCVLNYTITSTGDDGSTRDITVEVNDTDATINQIESGFMLCNNTYTFTIVANTFIGPGVSSDNVSPNKVDLLTPRLSLGNSGFSVTIMGMVPDNSNTFTEMDAAVSVQRSFPMTDDCGTSVVVNQPTNGDATVTFMDRLACRYAGQNVTYCLQFTTDQCDSATVMAYTEQLPPPLISSLSEGVSSTAGTVTLMVDVNDQHNCADQDSLTITAVITSGGTVIDTQENAAFADGSITFESVRDGDFTCTVTVVDGMGPIESQVERISCGNSPTSASASIGGIVGGVVGGVTAVIVVIVVLVILIVMKKKGKGDPEKNVTATEMKPTGTYQPEADDHPDSSGPTATYADPRSIEHEGAGPTGDEYALVIKPSKKKNTNTDTTGDAGAVGDMYSVPDKSKKQKNAGLVYADLEVTNQSRRAAPVAPRGIGSAYPAANDNEPVMYSTVQ